MEYIRDCDTGEYICPFDGCEFRSGKNNQSTMFYHMKKHYNYVYPFKCKYCNFGSINNDQLQKHIENRHKDKINIAILKQKSYMKCPYDVCSFHGTKGNCIIHLNRIHFADITDDMMELTDDKYIKCTVCEYEFKTKTAFYYHAFDCMEFPDSLKILLKSFL